MENTLKVLFLHGMEGTPEGSKPTFMKEKGFKVIAPVLPKENWELSVKRAKDSFENFEPDVVVGSSRGGALATALNTGNIPKILIAPAWTKFAVEEPLVNKTTTILHCLDDDLVNFEDSMELAECYNCKLIECGERHRMSDDDALGKLLETLETFLELK